MPNDRAGNNAVENAAPARKERRDNAPHNESLLLKSVAFSTVGGDSLGL